MATQFNNLTKAALLPDDGNITTSGSINILGVAPEEIYTSGTVASFLNRNISSKNLISIVIDASGQGASVANDTVIFLINNEDNFKLPTIESTWSRPLSGDSGGGVLSAIGSTIKSGVGIVNSALTASSGISLYNKMAYLPVWTGTQPLKFSLSCTLIATSNAFQQVYQALLMLQFLTLPQTTGSDFVVNAPGSSFNPDALQNLIKNTQQSTSTGPINTPASNTNISQIFTGGNQISIGIGSLAYITPILIKSVNIEIPNIQTTNSSSSTVQNFINSITNSPNTGGTGSYPPYATVTLSCESYYPAAHTIGNNFDAYQFMPYNEDSSMTNLFTNG